MMSVLRPVASRIRQTLSTPLGNLGAAAAGAPGSPSTDPGVIREWIAQLYLRGEGIEVGALHNPLRTPTQARVRYVDRMSVPDLLVHYSDLPADKLVHVDIIDNGERLTTLASDSQDFVIANHFLEHCGDPIGTIENFLRVLRPNGILYMAVPDKRYTFDRDRPVTPLEHLIHDHQAGPEGSRQQHFEEWTRLVDKVTEPAAAQRRLEELLRMDYSIHFHVWTQTEFLGLLHYLRQTLALEIELITKNVHEIICILRKTTARAA